MITKLPIFEKKLSNNESGFTLVELIVGLILSAIVLALIFNTVLDVSHDATRYSQRTKAQRATAKAFDMLSNDLRSAQAPERGVEFTNGPDGLRRVLLSGENPDLEAHDILVAQPDRLVFFMEAENSNAHLPSPQDIECVEWVIVPSGALHRRVYRYSQRCQNAANAVNAVMDHEILPPPAKPNPPKPFSYKATISPPNVMALVVMPECTDKTFDGSSNMREKDAIVSVRMNLYSFVAYRGARGDQELQSDVSISSRQSNEYRYGIGCSS